jgi:prolyl 4-hydroxylase
LLQHSALCFDVKQGSVAMKPRRGDAIVFHSLHPDGRSHDQHALHTACPVVKGVKYVGESRLQQPNPAHWAAGSPFTASACCAG